jgi:[acyl-carrier-protein] S-malonyltransferase
MTQTQYDLAFVFPGQGSQSVGMLNALAAVYPTVKRTFEEASEVLGLDLWRMVTEGPVEHLNQTQNTQPVMLAAGIAVWRIWNEHGGMRPQWMAGHSLGEYTALVASGALAFADAVALVAERGRLMQEAVPAGSGAMAAILGLDDHVVVNACAEVANDEIVAAANFNAPGQVVIAGQTAAVERAMAELKARGAKRAVLLPVSVPSHCLLMQAAADQLAEKLSALALTVPSLTLIHNADVKSHSSDDVMRHVLQEQLFKPVRWVETIKFMQEQGVNRIVECGPGKVLLGLNKRIAADAAHYSLFDADSLKQVLEQIHG